MKIHTPCSPLFRGETPDLSSIKRGWGCVMKIFSDEKLKIGVYNLEFKED